MSSVASVTGGGDDDPSTISQFSFQRKFGVGAGQVNSVTSNSAEIIATPSTGDVVLTYAGPEQVTSGGDGISVVGNEIFNTGVTSLAVAGTGLTINQPTGDVVITGTGGGGGPAAASRLSMMVTADFTVLASSTTATWGVSVPGVFSNMDPGILGVSADMTWGTDGTFSVTTSGSYLISYAFVNDFFSTATAGNTFFAACVNTTSNTTLAVSSPSHTTQVDTSNLILPSQQFTSAVTLEAGQVYQVIFYAQLASVDVTYVSQIPENFNADPDQFVPYPAILFSCVSLGGTGSGSSSPEAFAIFLAEDFDFGGSGGTGVISPWQSSPLSLIGLSDTTIFDHLTLGSLNLATGEFTCGLSGEYQFFLSCNTFTETTATYLTLAIYDDTTGSPIWFGNAGEAIYAILDLVASHVYHIEFATDGTGQIPLLSTLSSNWPNMVWSMAYLSGRGSGGDGSSGESFALAMVNGINLGAAGADVPVIVAPLTDTVDTGSFPGLSPKMLHNRLVGPNAVDLTNGFFTCGTAGQYLFQFPTSYIYGDGTAYFALRVNGTAMASDGAVLANVGNKAEGTPQGSAILNLVPGDQVELVCSSGDPGLLPGMGVINNTNTAGGNATYSVVWKCVRIMGSASGGGGGGGGGGTVLSVTGGTGINVDNTDPTNPVVSNAGVRSVAVGAGLSASASTGAITLTNTGVRQLQAGPGISLSAGTGNVTVSATGGGGGGGGAQTLQLMTPSGAPTASGLSGNISGNFLNLSNTGILQMTAGPGISLTGNQLNKTITATGQYPRSGFFVPLFSDETISNPGPGPIAIGNWRSVSPPTSANWMTTDLGIIVTSFFTSVTIPRTGLWRITGQLVTDNSGARMVICKTPSLTPLVSGNNITDATRQVSQIDTLLYFVQGDVVTMCLDQTGTSHVYRNFGAFNLLGTYWSMFYEGPIA